MKENKFIEKLRKTIDRFELLKKGDRVLVAVSGGPDSVALLYGLLSLKPEFDLKIYVAHLNHKLRGDESDEDEKFVRKLADRLKLEFFSKRIDVKKEAKNKKLSIEECAREIRYDYLQKLADRIKADKIATGHQADDQAETFLMRLLRGAGGTGLSGIPSKRGKIIRPLIQIKREVIEKFLKDNKIASRVDSSNYLTDYFRNKIRLSLLPQIKENFNPNIIDVLNRTGDIISHQQEYIEKTSEQLLSDIGIRKRNKIILDLEKFAGYDICLKREMIRLCVKGLKGDLNQVTFDSVERALELADQNRSGKKIKLANKIWMEISKNELVCYEEEARRELDFPIVLPGKVEFKDWGIKVAGELLRSGSQRFLTKNQNIAFLDWGKLQKPFHLRNRRKADRFKPLGMKGTKTIADFFVDAKLPHHQRDDVPILTSKGKIVWVVGYRISDEFKVTDKTKETLKVEVNYTGRI